MAKMKNKKRERNSTTTITALQCVGIKSKSDLLLLMCDEKKIKKLSHLQLRILRNRLKDFGCDNEEIIAYSKIINNCIKNIEESDTEYKTTGPIHTVSQKAFFRSNLYKVKTLAERQAAKVKYPSAYILYHHNGGK